MYIIPLTLLLLSLTHVLYAKVNDTDLNETSEKQNGVKINKCCLENELVVDGACRLLSLYNQTIWTPEFNTEDGNNAKVKDYNFITGIPDCATTQQRPIFDTENSEDKLHLLTDGRLRHVIHYRHSSDTIEEDPVISTFSLHDSIAIPEIKEQTFIHNRNKYCMDKVLITTSNITCSYALVCIPEVKYDNKELKVHMNYDV